MAVSPAELDQLSREFQHFAHYTTEFFDLFEQFTDALQVLHHPETITVEKIQELRNVMLTHRSQWENYRDGLRDMVARLSDLDVEPERQMLMRTPVADQEPNLALGFAIICVIAAAAFAVGAILI